MGGHDSCSLSLAGALEGYRAAVKARFHMPGHKGVPPFEAGAGTSGVHRALAGIIPYDVTELPGLDDLSDPDGAIAGLEAQLAGLYGAQASFLGVGGSTLGVQAAIMAACGDGDAIILPRDSHRAAIAGVILAGAVPYHILPERDKRTGLTLGPTPEAYEAAFEACSRLGRRAVAALVTSPTYYGACPDLAGIARACRRHGAMCLVDEAHGAHLRFAPGAPPDALACGAHIVAQSPHKTLPALTQSAWLHVGEGADAGRVKDRLLLLRTSSPSYPLMLGLEAVIAWLGEGQAPAFERAAQLCRRLCGGAEALGYTVHHKPADTGRPGDPIRALIGPGAGMGFDGNGLFEGLMARGIYPELGNDAGCLLMLGASTSAAEVDCTLAALADMMEAGGCTGCEPARAEGGRHFAARGYLGAEGFPPVTPRCAALAPYDEVPLADAVGRIAACTVAPSPPSVGVILPGDAVTAEAVAALEDIGRTRAKVHGAGTGGNVRVVRA